jgi:cytidine deaminase
MVLDQATKLNLVKQANEVRRFAYAPYSKYPVGAALLTSTGKIYTGVNIENIDFTDGICAERTPFSKRYQKAKDHLKPLP